MRYEKRDKCYDKYSRITVTSVQIVHRFQLCTEEEWEGKRILVYFGVTVVMSSKYLHKLSYVLVSDGNTIPSK